MKNASAFSRDQNYDQFKKKKSPRLKKIRHSLELLLLKSFHSFSNCLSVSQNQAIGRGIGSLAYKFLKKDRNIAEYQLKFALPSLEQNEREEIIKGSFQNFGQSILEILCSDKIKKNPDKHIRVHNKEIFERAYKQNKGVIVLTAHYGNWELMPIIFKKFGWKAKAIARNQDVKGINALMNQKRENENFKIIGRGDSSAAREIIHCLKNKEALILVVDQDTKVQSVFAPFFGKLAKTPKSPASLAIKFSCPVVYIHNYRDQEGKINFVIEDSVVPPYENSEQGILSLTEKFNSDLEQFIRLHPSQWAWFHRRWKSRPANEQNNS